MVVGMSVLLVLFLHDSEFILVLTVATLRISTLRHSTIVLLLVILAHVISIITSLVSACVVGLLPYSSASIVLLLIVLVMLLPVRFVLLSY
jgi:hypothetical protein